MARTLSSRSTGDKDALPGQAAVALESRLLMMKIAPGQASLSASALARKTCAAKRFAGKP